MTLRAASERQRPKGEALIIAVAAVALLLALAYWRTLSAYRAPYRILQDQPIPGWIDQLYAWRWAARGAMLAAGAMLAFVELRWAGLTRRLKLLFARPVGTFVLILCLALTGRSYLMTPGRMALRDGLNNMASIVAVRAALEQGHWPPFNWSNEAWLGFPWMQFHNSLFYYEGGLLDLALHDGYLSMKAALLANHMLAAITMFVYVRRLARSPWAALVSTMVWTTTFFHYHYFIQVGSVHLSLLIPLLPGALWCVECILDGARRRAAFVALALAIGLGLWVHTYYGAVLAVLIVFYGLIAVAVRKMDGRTRAAHLIAVISASALGCLSAISQWLPQLVERNLVGQWNRGLQFVEPTIGWRDVLSFRQSFLTADFYGGYVGQSVVALAAIGLLLALISCDRRIAGLAAWLAVTLYLSLGPRYLPFDNIFGHIPFGEFVYAVRYPGKYLLFAEFALAALAGVAVREIGRVLYLRFRGLRQFQTWMARLALFVASVIAAEMIFLTLQVNSLYPEGWLTVEPGQQEAYDWIRMHGDGVSRVLNLGQSHMEASALSGQPSFFSHIEETPASSLFVYWLQNGAVRADVNEGRLSSSTRTGLAMADVGYLILVEAPPPEAGWKLSYAGAPFSVWQFDEHGPAIAAPALEIQSVFREDDFKEVLEGMDFDQIAHTADHIPVTVLPAALETGLPAAPEGAEPAAGPLRFTIRNYQVDLVSVVLDYDLSQPAYIQLAYSAYPYLEVYLDGQRQDYFWTAFDFVGLAAPAGAHRVELRPVLSPLRVVSYWIDGLALLAIAALWLSGRRQRKQPGA